MSYLVLARKYRPQLFSEVIGQTHITRTLSNAIEQGRVHHAFLFCGARGTGKTTTARILAKALNCEKGPTPTPCNKCTPCTEIAAGSSVDVFEIDGASHTGVDDIRELRDNVRYLPTTGKRKIYIIDEVHMLSVSAFNALLKTLEEPPEHVTFMFATTEPHKIPATILSRCQRFDLKRVAPAELFPLLEAIVKKEKLKAESAALELLAAEASGSVRDALSLLDQVIAYAGGKKITRKLAASVMGITDRKALMAISAALLERDVDGALAVLDQVFEGGQDLVHFARSVLAHLRDLVLTRVLNDPKAITRLSEDELKQVQAQIKEETAGRLLQLFESMARAADDVARSEFPKMTLEMSLTELALAEPLVPVGQLVERLELLESRLMGRAGPRPAGGSGSGGTDQPAKGKSTSGRGRSRSKRGSSASAAAAEETKEEDEQENTDPAEKTETAPAQEPEPTDPMTRWAQLVEAVRKRERLLGVALFAAELESLEEQDSTILVNVRLDKESFHARQLAPTALARAAETASEALGRKVKINLNLTEPAPPETAPGQAEGRREEGAGAEAAAGARAEAEAGAGAEASAAAESAADAGERKKTGRPRSLMERHKLAEEKRRQNMQRQALKHPAVQEVQQVLGGKVREVRVP